MTYPVQSGADLANFHEGYMKNMIDDIDAKKKNPGRRSTNLSPRNLAHHDHQFAGIKLQNFDDTIKSTTNLSAVELTSVADENFDDPRLYFGEEAKEEFWDLYKSERRFKDFTTGVDDIKDPRFAYLQSCKELMVYPKTRMLIRDKKSNHIDYSNM